jgi:hypothetical protein
MVLVSATKLAAQASECDRLSTWVVTLSSLDPVTCTDVGRVAHTQRLLGDFRRDRCLARLGPGVRRDALISGCPPGVWVWLSFGLRLVGHRDEAWLKRGLLSS